MPEVTITTATSQSSDSQGALPKAPAFTEGVLPENGAPWVTWKPTDDGRKVPRAPYQNPGWPGKYVSAQDPDVWTTLDTVTHELIATSGFEPALVIRDREDHPEESKVLIDFDDARDPETQEMHPRVREYLGRAGSYGDVSTSGTGVHILCRGLLPDGVTAIRGMLPHDSRFPVASIEVYESARFVAMSGDHLDDTPREIRDAQVLLDELADEYATVTEGTPDGVLREPRTDKAELADVDATMDMADVYDAIQQVEPRDIRLRSAVTEERGDGSKSLDPSWSESKSGTRLAQIDDGWVYREGMVGLDALQVVALEERIITDETEYPSGEAFWQAVDAFRDRGAHIPEYVPSEREATETAVLPPAVRDLSTSTEWDWREAGRDGLTQQDARDRTTDAIKQAYASGDRVLIDALPTLGKTYGSVKAARESGQQITMLTGRGREEQYQQLRECCEELGLDHYTLPSFAEDCPSVSDDAPDEIRERVWDWYNRGATPQTIHAYASEVLGEELPCQQGGECPYTSKWRFEPEEYDVLIGHYLHGYNDKVTDSRTVVVDEFPSGEYELQLGEDRLPESVSCWLRQTPGVPFEDYTDLIENRDDRERAREAGFWFHENGLEPDEEQVLEYDDAHASARLAAFVLLCGEDIGNRWEQASFGDRGRGAYDREKAEMHVLRPPDLKYASGVVALDGTPTRELWELSLGERLNHRQVLSDSERREYIQKVLDLNLVRTTEHVKPYNSPGHVTHRKDAALLETVRDAHDQLPSLITTVTAEDEYEDAGLMDLVAESKHFGNVLGSNEYDDTRLGVVVGSNHYGDDFLKRWGAYAGESVERNDGKGADLSYGGFGDTVLRHVREHNTLQAAMRYGRDGNGAVVYVHTDTLPAWVPLAGEGRVLRTWSDGMQDVISALEREGSASVAELAAHPDVDVGQRQVLNIVDDLVGRGVLAREQDNSDGRCIRYTDDGLARLPEHGEAELEPVGIQDLSDSEVNVISRSSTYTWDFVNLVDKRGSGGTDGSGGASEVAGAGSKGGGSPSIESD